MLMPVLTKAADLPDRYDSTWWLMIGSLMNSDLPIIQLPDDSTRRTADLPDR